MSKGPAVVLAKDRIGMVIELLRNPLGGLAVLFLTVIWAVTFHQISSERDRADAAIAASTANIVLTFEQNVTRAIKEIDLQIKFLRQFHQRMGDAAGWESIIDPRYEVSPIIAQISAIGPDGRSITGNVPLPGNAKFFVGDREHFKVHVNAKRDELFISKPVVGRASGKWSIQLTRRFENADGSFGGVIVASLDPERLMAEYESLALGHSGGMALVGIDGLVYGGSGVFRASLGRGFREGGIATKVEGHRIPATGSTVIVQTESSNTTTRITALRHLEGLPFEVVAVATSDPIPLGGWGMALPDIAAAIISSLLVLGTIGAAMAAQLQSSRNLAQRNAMELEKKLAEASADDRSLFLAVMSHEIRTPLNGVLGALDLVRDDVLSERGRRHVNIATQSGEALLSLIDDILSFSKAENDDIQLAVEPFSIEVLLKSVEDAMRTLVTKSSNTLSTITCPEAGVEVMGDARRFRQVLFNLVTNANKFTTGGSITLRVDCIRQTASSRDFRISVTDTGIGIPAEKQRLIFDRFHTLDASYSRRTDGTGLGLAICDMLVSAMRGKIDVKSEVGKGSTFSFDLSLPTAEQSAPATAVAAQLSTASKCADPLKILLAEDNSTNAFVATQMLTVAGHMVHRVDNGREAVVAASQQPFDVILMDISMPEMDGVEATAAIRSSAGLNASTPIIALTAHAFADDQARFLAAKMDGYLSKPIRKAVLLNALSAYRARLLPAAPVVATQVDHAELLDVSAFVEFISERPIESVLKTLEIFIAELDQKAHGLALLLLAKDARALQMLAHSTMGSGSLVGASRLVMLSRAIEAKCKSGLMIDWSAASELLTTIRETINIFDRFRTTSAIERLTGRTAAAV